MAAVRGGDGRCLLGPNAALVTLAVDFARSIGFRGIADMDWRLDVRDGSYKLLDFNPRVGAQFRLFESDARLDVVRAMHVDLTGRPLPEGHQVDGRRYIVEDLAVASAVAYRRRLDLQPPRRRQPPEWSEHGSRIQPPFHPPTMQDRRHRLS